MEIEQNLTAGLGEGRTRRIRALEQLAKARLTNGRTTEVLCKVAANFGTVEPDFVLVTKCLTKLANSDESGLARFIRLVEERQAGAIQCACRVLSSLRAKNQAWLARSLSKELLQRDTRDNPTEDLVLALKQQRSPDARRAITKELAGCLDSPDPLKILHAVAILSHIADASVERPMIKVLRKLLDGYYRGYEQTIREGLCSYFERIRSKAAVPALLRGIESGIDEWFPKAMGRICDDHPEVQVAILKLYKKADGKPQRDTIKLSCLRTLSAMRKVRPQVSRLAKMVTSNDLQYTSFKAEFRNVLLRSPKEAKPLLLEMLRGENEVLYEFGLEVLKEMQVPVEEVAQAIGINPVLAIYKYFFGERPGGLGLRTLWEAKAKLGENVGGTTKKFDHLLRHLLSCLGFVTLDVDPSGKMGVDTIAFPPRWSYVLLIGSTTGVIGDNLQKLAETLVRLRAALDRLARKIDILPIIATSMAEEINPTDKEYARSHGIVVLQQSDIDQLVDWVHTNRSYGKLLAYLGKKAGKTQPRTIVEALQLLSRR